MKDDGGVICCCESDVQGASRKVSTPYESDVDDHIKNDEAFHSRSLSGRQCWVMNSCGDGSGRYWSPRSKASLKGVPGKKDWLEPEASASIANRCLETGDPSRIRTCNPRSRNPLLYPVELWDRPVLLLNQTA